MVGRVSRSLGKSRVAARDRAALGDLGREHDFDTELGRALARDLNRTGHLRPLLPRPSFNKEARLLAQVARFEAGQVHLPQTPRGSANMCRSFSPSRTVEMMIRSILPLRLSIGSQRELRSKGSSPVQTLFIVPPPAREQAPPRAGAVHDVSKSP